MKVSFYFFFGFIFLYTFNVVQCNQVATQALRRIVHPLIVHTAHVKKAFFSKLYFQNQSAQPEIIQAPPVAPCNIKIEKEGACASKQIVKDVLEVVRHQGAPVTINIIHAPDNKGNIGSSFTRVSSQKSSAQAIGSFNKEHTQTVAPSSPAYHPKSFLMGFVGGSVCVELANLLFLGR